ncbi:LysE/ArgO family amino acid transporter [Paenibacillus puldeungensis]|uniref:LysE/ArgO family amino acid transporter n=1 Tax=Paenibacillus puldeungensis TaxID=696536 RepID=A0ABW3RT55_9BACL
MIGAFIHGFVLAVGLIIPLGVQNIFVFNQGAAGRSWSRALPAVMTAALCDTVLITLAVLGVSMIILSLEWLKTVLFIVGACFMIYMGWSIWRSAPSGDAAEAEGLPVQKQIMFAMSVSLLNPHAIMDTIGVIGTSSLHYNGNDKFAFALAAIAVSWIWFAGLAIAGRMALKLNRSGGLIKRINQVSAFVVWAMAAYLLFTGIAF